MILTIPPGHHEPAITDRLRGLLAGLYGWDEGRRLAWRARFVMPESLHGDPGGKFCGRTRGYLWPLSRLENGASDADREAPYWRELVMAAHEESDRFTFALREEGVHVGTYAYRRGTRPYGEFKRWADQSKHLAILPYDTWHRFVLGFEEAATRYAVLTDEGAVVAAATARHDLTPLWDFGGLLGPYQGGSHTLNSPLTIELERC